MVLCNVMTPPIDRRNFVAQFGIATVGFCASSLLGPQRAIGAVIDEGTNQGALKLPLATFPTLRETGATVRVGLSPLTGSANLRQPRNGRFYPILVTNTGNDTFLAVEANCTHASYTVERPAGASFLRCPAHGSRFELDGAQISGPASADLQAYATCHLPEDDAVAIALPFMNYSLEISDALAPAGRIRLRFTARFSVAYEVLSKPDASAPWRPFPFSLTEGGPTDETRLVTDTVDRKVNLFLEPEENTSFFAVRALVDVR